MHIFVEKLYNFSNFFQKRDIGCHFKTTALGYEPADLTVHPPPPRTTEGGFIFFV